MAEVDRHRRALQGFAAWTLVVVVATGATAWLLANHLAHQEARDDAAHQAERMALAIAAPNVYRDPAPGREEGRALLDTRVRERIAEGLVLRVKVWDADGTVLYSDEPRLIGRRFEIDDAATALLSHGGSHAELTRLEGEENVLDRRIGRSVDAVVEAYAAFTSVDGAPLLFEAYFPAADLVHHEREVLVWLLPAMTTGPLLVAGLMFALGVWMSRRVRSAERESVVALHRVFAAAARERRLISREMHDSVLPELAAVRLTLESAAREESDPERRTVTASMTDVLSRQISHLRDMLMGEVVPSPARVGLHASLDALAEQARAGGLRVDVVVPAVELDDAAARLVLAVAQEGLRNVRRHAGAEGVTITVHVEVDAVQVVVTDDGRGPATETLTPGHGLGLIADTVYDLGGTALLERAVGGGTRLTVTVPLRQLTGEVASTSAS